jgi:hypothetical protein
MLSSAIAGVEESYCIAVSALAAADLWQDTKVEARREKDKTCREERTHPSAKVK